MPDENLLATLEQSLRQARATRARLAARLADLEAEAEKVRTELNEIDSLASQTEHSMFRIMSSMLSASSAAASAKYAPSDAEIEAALQRDNAAAARSYSGAANERASAANAHAHYDVQVPPIRPDIEPTSERFADRTIPQATAMLLREAGAPLHVNEIYNRLLEGGFQFNGHNPTISIAVSLNRNRRFRKVAPGTFDLTIRDASKATA